MNRHLSVYGLDGNDKCDLLTDDLLVVNGNYRLNRDEFGTVRAPKRSDGSAPVLVLKGYIDEKGEDYNQILTRWSSGERMIRKACRSCNHVYKWTQERDHG